MLNSASLFIFKASGSQEEGTTDVSDLWQSGEQSKELPGAPGIAHGSKIIHLRFLPERIQQ